MNKNLNDALFDIEKANALMYAIESTFLDITPIPSETERANKGAYVFYALWDTIRRIDDEIKKLDEDRRVVDAVYAADMVRKNRTLKNE